MRKPNILKDKSFAFALRIISLYKYLKETEKEYMLSKQILRSGTAIGALIRESENAASRKDFLNKLNVAFKKLMKQLIGWSFYLNQNTLNPNYIIH